MPLTDAACKNAKSTAKPLKLFDAGGLFLLVSPKGGKWWRFKYRFDSKEKLLSLGTYPEVPLAGGKDSKTGVLIEGARDRRDEARKLLAQGVDPRGGTQIREGRSGTEHVRTLRSQVARRPSAPLEAQDVGAKDGPP